MEKRAWCWNAIIECNACTFKICESLVTYIVPCPKRSREAESTVFKNPPQSRIQHYNRSELLTFTIWVDKKLIKNGHFWRILKTWSLMLNSVIWTKIGKCLNWKTQMRHFVWFSNTVQRPTEQSGFFMSSWLSNGLEMLTFPLTFLHYSHHSV